jgi:NifU-like protein involved in Fe-S cluster formation
MMDFDLYNRQILRLAASIPRIGRLESPDVSVTADSRLCGSRITIDLKLADDLVAGYAHEVRACAIGQAVASVVAQVIVGLPVAEIHAGAAALRAILEQKMLPTSKPWTALEPLLPVADVRSRHGSALLPFKALELALDEIGRRKPGRQPPSPAFDQGELHE